MPRYKISVEYDGTAYSGWQKQPNADTVEEQIESALSRILRTPVNIIGQGRTDSGVHAEAQTAHFDIGEVLDEDQLLYALLGVLPRDIAVWKIDRVADDFHARFHALSRRYRYQIVLRPSPLQYKFSEMVLGELDRRAMEHCAAAVLGENDFESFTKPDNETPDSVCEVTTSEFSESYPLWIYHIEANRFVRHMVRRLIGTMIQVGTGKRTVKEFLDMLENPSPNKNGHGASAKGLILEKVRY